MTKSKSIVRGGARPGAGRKPKVVAGPSQVDAVAPAKPGPIIPAGASAEELRKLCEALAYETLATVARDGASENARVAASRELLDRSLGKPKPGTAANPDSPDLFDDGWGTLLKPGQAAGRTN